VVGVNGQTGVLETDQYSNFHVEGNAGYWRRHYSFPNASVKNAILSSGNLRNYQESEQKIYAELFDYIFKKGSDLVGGKVIVTTDSIGYTVTLRGISFKPGTNKMAAAHAYRVQVNGMINSFDTMFIKDGKLKPNGRKSMDTLNDSFMQLFEFH